MVSISTDNAKLTDQAQSLADRLNIAFKALNDDPIQLVVTDEQLEIRANDLGNPIYIDFVNGKNAHRRQFGGGRGQPLAKAIGLKKGANPVVVDATAGFGRDAFVIASLGCQVTMIERQPLIALLLEDGLERAIEDDATREIAQRMSLINDSAQHYFDSLQSNQHPDVVYMDPMFPQRDKTALVKKDMQLLHQLVGPDTDSQQLLTSAISIAKKRVVIKRPKGAPFIADNNPCTSIASKNTRYDIYVTG